MYLFYFLSVLRCAFLICTSFKNIGQVSLFVFINAYSNWIWNYLSQWMKSMNFVSFNILLNNNHFCRWCVQFAIFITSTVNNFIFAHYIKTQKQRRNDWMEEKINLCRTKIKKKKRILRENLKRKEEEKKTLKMLRH